MGAVTQEIKKEYKKPQLATMGNIVELTQNINQLGPGDSQFSVLAPS